jgi:hypothetical protein
MARLSAFRVDSKAIEAGAWVKPGDEYDDLEIQTRGFTDVYTDAKAAKLRRAALQYGGDQAKIPNAVVRRVIVDCLIGHLLLDVRGLADEAGAPVAFAGFCDLLRDPDYSPLVNACIQAASTVGLIKAAVAGDDLGNSATPSA